MPRHGNSLQGPMWSPDYPVPMDRQLDKGLPDELLELGWGKFWSRREKRPYFYNRLTNKSQWNMPQLNTVSRNPVTATQQKQNEEAVTMEKKLKKLDIKIPTSTNQVTTTTSNKRKRSEDPEAPQKELEKLDIKKFKTELEVIDNYAIVKGAMLDIIRDKVIHCLNSLCSIKCLKQGCEHICGTSSMEDIMYCHVSLVQKYDMAYTSMKDEIYTSKEKEAGDMKCRMIKFSIQRGMMASEAEKYRWKDMLSEYIEYSETYSQVFEQLRAQLLALQVCQTKQPGNKAERNTSCVSGNFGLLHILD